MTKAYLLLGSNEGDRPDYLTKARQQISLLGDVFATSSLYETAAWGKTQHASFLNQVVGVETMLSAEQLLKTVLSIEAGLGRVRTEKWSPRTLDIDILFYGSEIIRTADLIVPHPAIAERRFTLVPMAEVAKGLVHPVLNKTMEKLLEECGDKLRVEVLKK